MRCTAMVGRKPRCGFQRPPLSSRVSQQHGKTQPAYIRVSLAKYPACHVHAKRAESATCGQNAFTSIGVMADDLQQLSCDAQRRLPAVRYFKIAHRHRLLRPRRHGTRRAYLSGNCQLLAESLSIGFRVRFIAAAGDVKKLSHLSRHCYQYVLQYAAHGLAAQ